MSVNVKFLERFDVFSGVNIKTLEYLAQRCVVKEFYRGAIVADGYSGKLLLVNRGVIGVAALYITPVPPLTKPQTEKEDFIPLIGVYGRGDTCVELFVTRNPNIYAESLTNESEVLMLEREDVLLFLERDVSLALNIINKCGRVISFLTFLTNTLKLPARERLDAVIPVVPFALHQEDLGRLCGLRRETVSRNLSTRRRTRKIPNNQSH